MSGFNLANDSCGPSNALQNLHKHSSVDRSLQQDRFGATNRGSQQQFRSAQKSPYAQQLNREFDEFSRGSVNSSSTFDQGYSNPLRSAPGPHVLAQKNTSNWANDFSNLSLDHTSTSNRNVNWNSEFQTGLAQRPYQPILSSSTNYGAQPSALIPHYSLGTLHNHSQNLHPDPSQMSEHNQIHTLTSREQEMKAFEMAFDQIESTHVLPDLKGKRKQIDESVQHLEPSTKFENKETMIEPDSEVMNEEDTSLSDIARHIVNSLEEEQNDKFKSSNFIALMQRISQNDVVLNGDKFVDRQGVDVRNSNQQQSHDHIGSSENKQEELDEILSPFEAAKAFAPEQFKNGTGDWEERFEEDDWAF